MRAPIHHLASIKSPTYIIEGTEGNHHSLLALEAENKNPLARTITVRDSDHFQLIHPVNTIFAQAIRESKEGHWISIQSPYSSQSTVPQNNPEILQRLPSAGIWVSRKGSMLKRNTAATPFPTPSSSFRFLGDPNS